MGVTFPLALAAGVVAFASPCFLPIVPIYLSYLMGSTPGQTASTAGGRRAAVAQALMFVSGFSIVFVTLWASIGVVGYVMGDFKDVLRIVGGAVLIVMGLHVAGLIQISALLRPVQVSAGRVMGMGSGGIDTSSLKPSYKRSALLGVAFGAGWTPCIGPILGAVIGMASVSGTVWEGALLLVAFSMGLGIPFVLIAAGATDIATRLGWLRRHETAVALASGALLIITGFLMISGLFATISGFAPSFL